MVKTRNQLCSIIAIKISHKSAIEILYLRETLEFMGYKQPTTICYQDNAALEAIHTSEQVADIFTKPLPADQFLYLRDQLLNLPLVIFKMNKLFSNLSKILRRTKTHTRSAERLWTVLVPGSSIVQAKP
mmetsp:Transcript_17019/g.56302  ORF Transcript_17019/g.56302 Transcript_17019/m.56302 type:complete len:129 (-) Transcript_17019:746-1132(-)